MTRTERLRLARDWKQHQMADYLGVSQPTVTRLEAGQPESGPVSRLLDILERQPVPSSADGASPPCSPADPAAGAVPPARAALSGEAA
jgi:transcriptional regulator with XRE-family HTH domain